jgi:hypothetical protein
MRAVPPRSQISIRSFKSSSEISITRLRSAGLRPARGVATVKCQYKNVQPSRRNPSAAWETFGCRNFGRGMPGRRRRYAWQKYEGGQEEEQTVSMITPSRRGKAEDDRRNHDDFRDQNPKRKRRPGSAVRRMSDLISLFVRLTLHRPQASFRDHAVDPAAQHV